MSAGFSTLAQTLFPALVRNASPEVSRRLIIAAAAVYFAANREERDRIIAGVTDLLGPGERSERAKGQVIAGIAEHYFEKLLVATRPRNLLSAYFRERVAIDSLSRLDEALGLGRGAIAVTAHWGAVEFIPAILADRGYPVTVVLEAKTRGLRQRLESLASEAGVELLIASRGDPVLEGILSALGRGRILVTQVDEVDAWRRRKSRTINLFGKELFFDHTLGFIAGRTRAPAVGLFCERREGLRYRLRCEELVAGPGAADLSRRALGLWERYTLEAPEQWYQWGKWEAMKAPAS